MGIVNNKEQQMGEFLTGAVVTKTANLYSVLFKKQLVAQYQYSDQAVMLAMDSIKLEMLLQDNNVFMLKAA
jgi:hypothetical protein